MTSPLALARQIIWQKWIDPYGDDINETEWPGAFGDFDTDSLPKDEEGRIIKKPNIEDDEDWKETQPTKVQIAPPTKPFKLFATPMGFVPMTEWTTPSKVFNFWIAHTNFRITREIQEILDTTDGVECLDVFTPYRWRIAIGHAFNTGMVKEQVMRNLNALPIKVHPIQRD